MGRARDQAALAPPALVALSVKPTFAWICLALLALLFVDAAFGVYLMTRAEVDLTLRNVGETAIQDVRVVGPGPTEVVGPIAAGSEVHVRFDVEREGALHVLFTVNGQKRRVVASGYETPNMDSLLQVDLGPNAGMPHAESVTPLEDL